MTGGAQDGQLSDWLPVRLAERAYRFGGETLLAPARAMHWRYLPLLTVYFGYGLLGVRAVAEQFWIKGQTTLSPTALAALAVWLTLPWTFKPALGAIVDSVPLLGSRRTSYVVLSTAMLVLSSIGLAASAAGLLPYVSNSAVYAATSILAAVGLALMDVVADAWTAEVVPRNDADGTPRPEGAVWAELTMVQVLGRIAVAFGGLLAALSAGWLASWLSAAQVFTLTIAVAVVPVLGALFVRVEPTEQRPLEWSIVIAGLLLMAATLALGLASLPLTQELVLALSFAALAFMWRRLAPELDPVARRRMLQVAIVFVAFRAMPELGEGYYWYQIDKLGFDEVFFGRLNAITSVVGVTGLWLFARTLVRMPIARVLVLFVGLNALLVLPHIALIQGVQNWTMPNLGISARDIALYAAMLEVRFGNIAFVLVLTLIALLAPAGRRATWFALMATLLNTGLAAGALATKHVNIVYPISRGDYSALANVAYIVVAIGLVVPLLLIWRFARSIGRQQGAG
jgi:MFS family permease